MDMGMCMLFGIYDPWYFVFYGRKRAMVDFFIQSSLEESFTIFENYTFHLSGNNGEATFIYE